MRPLLLLPLLVLFRSLALAQNIPDAAAVAGRIGQAVEFQDEVKAVSFSRSTIGYYLSFGAPYPKQVLSVWMREKVYDRLPHHTSMVGRTVRIAGQLETSPTGPLIKLDSVDSVKVLEVDESILTKPTLDGKQDRAQFESAIYQTFRRGDFDTLNTLGRELLTSRERLDDGSWLSEAYFAAFRLRPQVSKERFADNEQLLVRWEQTRPTSTVLPMIKTGFHLDLAWKWRGNDYANTVTAEGWAGFKKELAIARRILESDQTGKFYPEYYALMQTLALGEGWKKEKYMELFDEATRRTPDYYPFYFNTAWYLMPQWHGRKGEWEAFAEHERQKHGAGGAGDGLYARIALAMKRDYRDLFHETAISWDTTASGLEYLIREHPTSRSLKNLYPFLCWRQHDRPRLQRSLPAIQPDPDMTIWVNLENVALAEKFAKSTGP
jgi:hypothetical protein